ADAITILQTTDIHDHANGSGHVGLDVDPITAMSTFGAYARIAAYVNSVRRSAGHPVILIDSGDWTMGTIYDLTLGSNPLPLYFITSMRYDAVTLGNHEWDYTPRGLAGMLALATTKFGFQTPIVASNMNLNGNTDLAPFVGTGKLIRPTYVETLSNGMKVGFLGLMGEDAAVDAPASAPVTFTALSQHYDSIQAIVDNLRNVQGAQIVIALSHSGTNASGTAGEDVSLAQHVHGIDVIASGHTHTPLDAAHAVKNGTWTTQIIDAGSYGTNVARFDVNVNRAAGTVKPIAFNNVLLLNASLAAQEAGLQPDVPTTVLVNQTDHQLNAGLGPILSQFFPDYSPTDLGKGIYHPVGSAAQTMVPNDRDPVLAPNGLGNLAADAVRSVPNSIISQTLTAVGGNPANLPGYDFTPVQMGVVGTGVIRGTLSAGIPLTFADIYNVLPLGISPDQTQALPVGYPMISTYVDVNDVKKIAALQLVGQANLVGSSFYLNLSGIRYTLSDAGSYDFFKYATAGAVLSITTAKVSAGSQPALQALFAIFSADSDGGAAMLAAANAGNPYATAIVTLNDTNPTAAQKTANITAFGKVAAQAIVGTQQVSALIAQKAVGAIDTVSGFSPADAENTGSATAITSGRIRVTADLYSILLLNAVEAQYGIKITPFQTATGTTVLADIPTILGNRVDISPSTPGVQEMKEWMALLQYVGSGLHGTIGPEYASSINFTDFPGFGAAVKNRNASYPLPQIGQLIGTESALSQQP
ncbi:MAG TPA: metallophosphoesterase, partial [Thermoanaerobaculia bacterium]|nr:metallophosphoesterase [Thermoanaerobaculia bacterium]